MLTDSDRFALMLLGKQQGVTALLPPGKYAIGFDYWGLLGHDSLLKAARRASEELPVEIIDATVLQSYFPPTPGLAAIRFELLKPFDRQQLIEGFEAQLEKEVWIASFKWLERSGLLGEIGSWVRLVALGAGLFLLAGGVSAMAKLAPRLRRRKNAP